jgi:transcriptional regulator with XRE-family HTH domain
MISARQVRAGRALLGWSQRELAARADISINALIRLERGTVQTRPDTFAAVETVLRAAGVVFFQGNGVRLRPQPPPE